MYWTRAIRLMPLSCGSACPTHVNASVSFPRPHHVSLFVAVADPIDVGDNSVASAWAYYEPTGWARAGRYVASCGGGESTPAVRTARTTLKIVGAPSGNVPESAAGECIWNVRTCAHIVVPAGVDEQRIMTRDK